MVNRSKLKLMCGIIVALGHDPYNHLIPPVNYFHYHTLIVLFSDISTPYMFKTSLRCNILNYYTVSSVNSPIYRSGTPPLPCNISQFGIWKYPNRVCFFIYTLMYKQCNGGSGNVCTSVGDMLKYHYHLIPTRRNAADTEHGL
jgi:hypothetical protein